jgi:hypothetical protein
MASHVEENVISTFLPNYVIEKCCFEELQPSHFEEDAVVFFLDISGFSKLAGIVIHFNIQCLSFFFFSK